MIANLAAGAANCTGTWSQKWKCGWNQPTSATLPHAGYDFGHTALPALVVLAVVILLVRAVKKRRKSRSSSPAASGARR